MTSPEPTPEPINAPTSKKPGTPWWLPVIVVLGALPAVLALIIFFYIVNYSVAHDPDTCPYAEGAVREVREGVSVREDTRHCMDDVEDHRWVVLRDGMEELSLGNLPLMGDDVSFMWTAHLDEDRVVVEVEVPGRGELTFREPERE